MTMRKGVSVKKLFLTLSVVFFLMSCKTMVITAYPEENQRMIIINDVEYIVDERNEVRTEVAMDLSGDYAVMALRLHSLSPAEWLLSWEDWSLELKDRFGNTFDLTPVEPAAWMETQEKVYVASTALNVISLFGSNNNAVQNQRDAQIRLERAKALYSELLKRESIFEDRKVEKYVIFDDAVPGEYEFRFKSPDGVIRFSFKALYE